MFEKNRFVGFLLLLVALASVHVSAGVLVDDAYIRGGPPGKEVAAAFFRLTNQSGDDCDLIGASSAVAGEAEIHAHFHQKGLMQMRRVNRLTLPAGETVVFEPGGYHLMLLGIEQSLVDGDRHSLTLLFSGCPEQTVQAEVRSVLR